MLSGVVLKEELLVNCSTEKPFVSFENDMPDTVGKGSTGGFLNGLYLDACSAKSGLGFPLRQDITYGEFSVKW